MALEKVLEDHPDVVRIKSQLASFDELPKYDELFRVRESVVGGLMDYCDDIGVYQLLSYEFVYALAGQLRMLSTKKPVLEVCAGSGKLAHHLRKQGSTVIATDSYVQRMVRDSSVEKLKHNAALRKYDPEVVIASWIPGESRLGLDILRYPSVKHFICIGEGQGYSCGHDGIYKLAKPKKLRFIERFSIGFMDFHQKMSLVQQFDRPEASQ